MLNQTQTQTKPKNRIRIKKVDNDTIKITIKKHLVENPNICHEVHITKRMEFREIREVIRMLTTTGIRLDHYGEIVTLEPLKVDEVEETDDSIVVVGGNDIVDYVFMYLILRGGYNYKNALANLVVYYRPEGYVYSALIDMALISLHEADYKTVEEMFWRIAARLYSLEQRVYELEERCMNCRNQ